MGYRQVQRNVETQAADAGNQDRGVFEHSGDLRARRPLPAPAHVYRRVWWIPEEEMHSSGGPGALQELDRLGAAHVELEQASRRTPQIHHHEAVQGIAEVRIHVPRHEAPT